MLERDPTIAAAATQILALINSRPTSPRHDEVEAILSCLYASTSPSVSPLAARIREAIALAAAAEDVDCRAAPHQEAATIALVERRDAQLYALADQIPDPPSLFEHSLMRAEVAYHFADKDLDDRLIINDDDCTAGPAARLIKSVLQLGGRYHG